MLSRTYKTEGIIIKRINYGEADKILTIFTREHGKIVVIAKGIRKITSKRNGSLELFNRNFYFLARGKNFDIVTEVETLGNFLSAPTNFEKIGRIYYFCEVIDRLTAERVEEKEIYSILYNFLVFCRKTNIQVEDIEKRMNDDLKNVLYVLGFIDDNKRNQDFNVEGFIENLIEGKIKSKKMITR